MFFFEIWVAHSFCVKPYIYAFDDDLPLLSVVSVIFGSKTCFGVVISKKEPISDYKKVRESFDFVLSKKFFDFVLKFASYYYLSLGSILDMVFPSIAFKKPLPILLCFHGEVFSLSDLLTKLPLKEIKKLPMVDIRDVFSSVGNQKLNFELSLDQKEAVSFIKNSDKVCVLEGVTGSGKTVVALESIKSFDKKVLILVPEINLANGWVDIIKKHFGIIPFVFHSKVSKSFKKSFFHWAISDDFGFVVGTRSALMIPYKDLNYIIVDEEHSTSYRQDSYPYYHARDMAILLGRELGIGVLLISATPSLETIYNIKAKKYNYFKLSREPKHGLASIHYVKGSSSCLLAPEILHQVLKRFRSNQQVLFFLNRKGYAPYCSCNNCQNILLCCDCDSALTLYLGYNVVCHKCCKKSFLPKICPYCFVYSTWSFWGLGVQKLNEFLLTHFPSFSFSVVTCDSKNISSQLDDISNNRVNGIIATQILAQGHDFKNIGLVVVVDADMGLISTDFRAMERIYQLWQQIRGRSGRHEIKGDMILQYFKDDNKFLTLFKRDDVTSFLLNDRLDGDWPPFSRCAFLKFKGRNKEKLEQMIDSLNFNDSNIFGPLFWGVKNKLFEFRFLVKAKNYSKLKVYLDIISKNFKKCEIEVDPY